MNASFYYKEVEAKMDKTVIYVGTQRDGYVFRLRPRSREQLNGRYPEAPTVSSVFIGYDTRHTFEQIHRKIWNQISILLTGLTVNEINKLGGFIVINPSTNTEVYNSLEQYVQES